MKRKYPLLIALFAFVGISSCTKNFKEINTNPVQATSLDPGYLFANAQFSAAIATYNYQLEIVQQINTPYTGVLEGGNHNVVYDPSTNTAYNTLYTTSVKFLIDVLDKTKDNAAKSNLYNMARIWKAYVFQVLTDTYGDVPYFDAGNAYLQQSYLPKYDDQKAIYDDLLKELEDATNKLDASQPVEPSDLFYKGSVAQWKRLGNSLLLRVGMRFSKVDQAKAEAAAKKATDASRGGVFQSNADNAIIAFNSTFNSPTGSWFQATERGNIYLGEPMVDILKDNNDPRLKVIAVKYADPSKPLSDAGAADTDPANQEGMPYGYNESTIATAPGFPGKIGSAFKYSQVNRRTVGKIDAPEFFITHAQTQLLLAEAAQRGWITGGAADYYVAGVRAAMQQMAQFDGSATIAADDENAYVTAHPYNAATGLQQINTEYWVNSFLNGSESWANFRRSGYPALAPNPYPGADPAVKGGFIRRLTYPVREQSVNAENYGEAVNRMGADNLATRLFWDKE